MQSIDNIIRKEIVRKTGILEKSLNRESYLSEKRIHIIGDFMYEYTNLGEKAVMFLRSIGERIWNNGFTLDMNTDEEKIELYKELKALKKSGEWDVPKIRDDIVDNYVVYDKIDNLISLASIARKNYDVELVKRFARSLKEFHDFGYVHRDPSLYTVSYGEGKIYFTLLNYAKRQDLISNPMDFKARDFIGFYISFRFNSKKSDFINDYINEYNPSCQMINKIRSILNDKDGWRVILYPFKAVYTITSFGVMPWTLEKYKRELYNVLNNVLNNVPNNDENEMS